MDDIVIVAAARTPVGSFLGGLKDVSAAFLGQVAIKEVIKRGKLDPQEVDEVIMGQVLTGGTGQNPARQAALAAGLPKEKTALTINQVCGSGVRSIALGAQSIHSGDTSIVICGGQESMSQAPHCANLRKGQKMGNLEFIDTMIHDGIWCAINGYHMGITAENVAKKWQITREAQDEFSVNSQNKAEKAQKDGKFKDEITPVTIEGRKGSVVVEEDEYIRHGVTIESLQKLKPAFDKEGTVTAGNASGVNDGAAAVILMKAKEAEKRKLKPIVRIASWATAGVDPELMGSGPIPASKKALELAGWKIGDLDLIEANEAFAA
ncbi:MAG: acetyl-CoA C-acetyltransferase, partial [Pseudomonadota bacterium]|nr:acetyl-CoA C-acetyltransferase [Pseudomonadota bacterium]